jgi:hypothetical protein
MRTCYAWTTMSANNGDKARHNKARKRRRAQQEKIRKLRK